MCYTTSDLRRMAVGTLSMMLIQNPGLGLQNPVMSTDVKILNPQRAIAEFIRALEVESKSLTANRLQVVKEGSSDCRKIRDYVNKAKLEIIVNTLDAFHCCLFL